MSTNFTSGIGVHIALANFLPRFYHEDGLKPRHLQWCQSSHPATMLLSSLEGEAILLPASMLSFASQLTFITWIYFVSSRYFVLPSFSFCLHLCFPLSFAALLEWNQYTTSGDYMSKTVGVYQIREPTEWTEKWSQV